MDRCQNCLNILPRTVDRCPVCGHVPEATTVAPTESAADAQAPWSKESSRRSTPPSGGKEFLEALESKPDPVAAKPRIASSRTKRAPKRLGHDGAAPLHENVPRASRSSDFELPDSMEETRSVQAGSARINAKMHLGRSRRHNIYTGAGTIIAVLALTAGSAFGYVTSDAGKVTEAPRFVPVAVGDDPVSLDAPIANFDPAALITVKDSSCGVETTGVAVALESGVVLAPRSSVLSARRPVLQMGDGTQVAARLVGWDEATDFAVLEPDTDLAARTEFGSTGRFQQGTQLAVVSGDLQDLKLVPVVVKEISSVGGVRTSFSVVEAGPEVDVAEAPALRLETATLILDRDGRVVGIGTGAGNARLAEVAEQTIGELRSTDERPQPNC